jgi:antitoxin HigA-1
MTPAIHPGRLLRREMAARELSANRLAIHLGVPSGRITDILNGRRSITADTALRLGRYFGNAPQFWLDLQGQYDIVLAENENGAEIKKRVIPEDAALAQPKIEINSKPSKNVLGTILAVSAPPLPAPSRNPLYGAPNRFKHLFRSHSSIFFQIWAKTCSGVKSLVSITTASAAAFKGATLRPASRASRAAISAFIAA